MDASHARVRAVLIGGQPMFFQPLARWLTKERAIEASFVGADDAAVVERCTALVPDVAVVDQQSGNGSLASMVASLRSALPAAKILLLAERAAAMPGTAAVDAGCDGVVGKDEPAEHLAAALLAARGVAAPMAASPDQQASVFIPPALRLTVREREVLQLLAGGSSTAAIGERLRIARNTARAHVQRVIEKLGTHSKLEAVAVARRAGIINT